MWSGLEINEAEERDMKRKRILYGVVLSAVLVLVFCAGMAMVSAQDGGSVWKEIRRIASAEPDRMIGALRATRQAYQWKPGGKAEFDGLFMTALGLEYESNAVGVPEKEEAKRALKKRFEPSGVDALDWSSLTPLDEDN